MWRPGSKLVHPFNPELGVGVVRKVEGRFLTVDFPEVGSQLTLAAQGSGLSRLVLARGDRARLLESGEEVEISEARGHRYLLADGREFDDAEVWPLRAVDTPVDRLANLHLDSVDAFANRLAGLELMQLRESGGLGSFLGGRIEIFPHQLHAALRAAASDPVRWLFADEVGLGKTVEACLVLSALVRTGRAQRALVIAPSTLTIQWLGELYRKFHQIFVLLDGERVESVEVDYGEGTNPFEVHPFSVISLEMLASDPALLECARAAGLDAVVLDEAHRLERPEWTQAVGPLVRAARHALLLTATPLQDDRRGFFRLFSLLHSDLFESFEAFESALERNDLEVPFTSSVRRADVGGLPPRVPVAVDVGPEQADPRRDPRARWLASELPGWLARGEKALVFVHDVDRLEALATFLESETRTRITLFHERLSASRRDIEVASFRESTLPLLLCSEAGGEGRNFQFCHRMVHYDLPSDPVELEQRIGRLDRIGRSGPVEIVYFRCQGAQPDAARLFEKLSLFEKPAAGFDPALSAVAPALRAAASGEAPLDEAALLEAVRRARREGRGELARVLYSDSYTSDCEADMLARVPPDLEQKTRDFCVVAAEDLGFEVLEKSERDLYYIEFGGGARVDAIPGVEGGSRFLGSFDRREALEKEEVDFFASGHPLVEGLLLELEDGPRGRAALLEVSSAAAEGPGLLCLYKDGPCWQAVVVDARGTLRPEWVAPLLAALPTARGGRPERWGLSEGWGEAIRALARAASGPGTLVAAAFFRPSR